MDRSRVFKFLDSYTKSDGDVFFGREPEVEEIYRRCSFSKTLVVYGRSGTGKTSIVQCGLSNSFRDEDWLPIFVRRSNEISKDWISSIRKESQQVPKNKGNIISEVKNLYLDHFKPVYFLFDQFEELFIFGDEEEITTFFRTAKELLKSELDAHLIFIIREEYLAYLSAGEELIEDLLENRIRIEHLPKSRIKQLISSMCRAAGIDLEEGFEEELIERVGGPSGTIELSYLQVYLDAFVQKYPGADRFNLKMIDEVGNFSSVLRDFLQAQLNTLEDPSKGEQVLKAFVSTQGTKRLINIDELYHLTAELGRVLRKEELEELVNTFVDGRILRELGDEQKFELRHDTLAQVIYERITLAEKELMEAKQFVHNAYNRKLKHGTELKKEDLDYLRPYADRLHLKKEQRHFIRTSFEREKRRAKRKLRLMQIGVLILVVLLAFAGLKLYENYQEEQLEARINESNRLAELSMSDDIGDPMLAFLLAEKAHEINVSANTHKALLTAYNRRLLKFRDLNCIGFLKIDEETYYVEADNQRGAKIYKGQFEKESFTVKEEVKKRITSKVYPFGFRDSVFFRSFQGATLYDLTEFLPYHYVSPIFRDDEDKIEGFIIYNDSLLVTLSNQGVEVDRKLLRDTAITIVDNVQVKDGVILLDRDGGYYYVELNEELKINELSFYEFDRNNLAPEVRTRIRAYFDDEKSMIELRIGKNTLFKASYSELESYYGINLQDYSYFRSDYRGNFCNVYDQFLRFYIEKLDDKSRKYFTVNLNLKSFDKASYQDFSYEVINENIKLAYNKASLEMLVLDQDFEESFREMGVLLYQFDNETGNVYYLRKSGNDDESHVELASYNVIHESAKKELVYLAEGLDKDAFMFLHKLDRGNLLTVVNHQVESGLNILRAFYNHDSLSFLIDENIPFVHRDKISQYEIWSDILDPSKVVHNYSFGKTRVNDYSILDWDESNLTFGALKLQILDSIIVVVDSSDLSLLSISPIGRFEKVASFSLKNILNGDLTLEKIITSGNFFWSNDRSKIFMMCDGTVPFQSTISQIPLLEKDSFYIKTKVLGSLHWLYEKIEDPSSNYEFQSGYLYRNPNRKFELIKNNLDIDTLELILDSNYRSKVFYLNNFLHYTDGKYFKKIDLSDFSVSKGLLFPDSLFENVNLGISSISDGDTLWERRHSWNNSIFYGESKTWTMLKDEVGEIITVPEEYERVNHFPEKHMSGYGEEFYYRAKMLREIRVGLLDYGNSKGGFRTSRNSTSDEVLKIDSLNRVISRLNINLNNYLEKSTNLVGIIGNEDYFIFHSSQHTYILDKEFNEILTLENQNAQVWSSDFIIAETNIKNRYELFPINGDVVIELVREHGRMGELRDFTQEEKLEYGIEE